MFQDFFVCLFEIRMHVIHNPVDKKLSHLSVNIHVGSCLIVVEVSHFALRRHQTTGAVIARCGQPEVSWWGWRNADDEHLVQSIAKACAVDGSSRKHLSNGGYTNGHDLPDTDFGESSDWPTLLPPPQIHSHTDISTSASV